VFTQQTSQRSGNRLPDTGVAMAGIPCYSTRNCSGSQHHHFGSSFSRSDLLISSVRRRNCPGNRPTAKPSPNGRRGSRQSPWGNRSPKQGLSRIYPTGIYPSILSVSPENTRLGEVFVSQYSRQLPRIILPGCARPGDYILLLLNILYLSISGRDGEAESVRHLRRRGVGQAAASGHMPTDSCHDTQPPRDGPRTGTLSMPRVLTCPPRRPDSLLGTSLSSDLLLANPHRPPSRAPQFLRHGINFAKCHERLRLF